MSEPKIPARTELTVLSADDPKRDPLGFVVVEYDGTEVFKKDAPGVRLTNESDIQPGDVLLVTTLVGTREMVAYRDEYRVLRAEDDGLVADLVFNKDARHCWSSRYGINKSCLKRVTKTTVVP